MTISLLAFCEATSDHRLVSQLVDRVLAEVGPNWLADQVRDLPEQTRRWINERGGGRRTLPATIRVICESLGQLLWWCRRVRPHRRRYWANQPLCACGHDSPSGTTVNL